jgi:hypothetical protein
MSRRALVAFGLFGLATPALAQFGGRRSGGRTRPSEDSKDKSAERPRVGALETSLNEFHEDLKLNAAQEDSWLRYTNQVRALASDVARQRAQPLAANALLSLERAVDVARDRLTAMEDVARAGKAFYATLTPEQQATCNPRLANIPLLAMN